MWQRVLGSKWFYLVAATGLAALFFITQFEVVGDPRPVGEPAAISELKDRDDLNILFVLIDTLRADRLGAYGYERDTSPNIDALASSGIRFAQHMSQSSWTKCSMASMWTGLYPVRTGVLRSPQAVASEATMPAEILKEAGYHTYALWRNGWIGPNFGFAQGFEVYYSPRARKLPATVRREKPSVGIAGTDQDIVRSAIEFLRTRDDDRWFLYLHLMDVHQYVYDEDTALFGTTYSDIYDNSIRWVDRVLGRLIHELDTRGLRDETMIVVLADHGEAFGEHGREGHARDVYSEVTTTPFIISLPFRLEEEMVIDSATANVDVWPTLLDLLALPGLEDPDGSSRVPELLAAAGVGPDPDRSSPRFAQLDENWGRIEKESRPMIAVSEGGYRLVLRSKSEQGQLYEQESDPTDQHDIGDREPETRKRLRALVDDYLERPPAPWGSAPEIKLDDAELEQLRALGYSVK
jgi:arylsulfatase A-like enzyme